MKFEIKRIITCIITGETDEQCWDGLESKDIESLVKKISKSHLYASPENIEFSDVCIESNTATFKILNRDRYKGDDFTISPID